MRQRASFVGYGVVIRRMAAVFRGMVTGYGGGWSGNGVGLG
jgi:hypothetical protein